QRYSLHRGLAVGDGDRRLGATLDGAVEPHADEKDQVTTLTAVEEDAGPIKPQRVADAGDDLLQSARQIELGGDALCCPVDRQEHRFTVAGSWINGSTGISRHR